jgi:FHA domain
VDEAYLDVRRQNGAEHVPLAGDRLTLGRGSANDISFPSDKAISRAHAIVERIPGGWQLRDVGSANGTFLNGAKLDGGRILEPDDEVVLGESSVVFRAGSADDGTDIYPAPARPRPAPGADEARGSSAGYLDLGEEWGGAPPGASADRDVREFREASPEPAPRSAERTPVAADPQRRTRGTGHVRGVARGVQIRRTQDDRELLAFRVDSYDESGNRLAPVAVELMDYQGGAIGEGDEVEVSGRWTRGTLRATKVVNLSTRAEAHGGNTLRKVVFIVALVLVLCFFAFIAYSIITAPTVNDPFQS